MCLVLLYYCFHVTDPEPAVGFFRGNGGWITVRILIVILGIFHLMVTIFMIAKSPKVLCRFSAFVSYIFALELHILNLWIVIESSLVESKVSKLRLVQVSSVATIQMWVSLFYWLRVFPATGLYVRMIGETIYDLRNFILMFFFCICMFGSSLLILDRYELLTIEGYEPLLQSYFGNVLVDSFINEYL